MTDPQLIEQHSLQVIFELILATLGLILWTVLTLKARPIVARNKDAETRLRQIVIVGMMIFVSVGLMIRSLADFGAIPSEFSIWSGITLRFLMMSVAAILLWNWPNDEGNPPRRRPRRKGGINGTNGNSGSKT